MIKIGASRGAGTSRRLGWLATACAAAAAPAWAMEIKTGDPDLTVRFDNTVRYNIGVRTQKQDQRVLNTDSYDDSDSKFGRGDAVTNRFDLLSEFDAVYKKSYGVRLSAAAWYDHAYHNTNVKTNPAFTVPGFGDLSSAHANNQYTDFTKRYNRGPSGEVLDAFVFGRFNAGSVPAELRLGRHNVYWGESFFSFVHGVAYSQGPVDVRKLAVNPGTEAKEAFMPLNQLSGQVQLSDTVSVAGQYMLQWEPTRLPDGGTYLGAVDFMTTGGGTYVVNPAAAAAANAQAGLPAGTIQPVPFLGVTNRPKDRGDWGVKTTWRPEALDGTLGFYYREYADKLPQIVLGGLQPGLPIPSDVRLSYLRDNKLLGVSLAKQIGPVSVGSELVYRKNTGLLMGGATVVGSEPRGDTWHALANVFGTVSNTPFFDTAVYIAELTYSRVAKVTANANNFNAVGYAGCPTGDKWDGCATRDALGLALRFEPTWNQVWSGVNVSAPMFVSWGVKGNSPVLFGGYQGAGSYSFGINANVVNQYTIGLQYNGYLLKAKEGVNALGLPSITSVNGIGNTSDRGWVSLTLKTTF